MNGSDGCKRACFGSSPAAKRARTDIQGTPAAAADHGFTTVSAQSQRDTRRTNDSLHKTIQLDPVTCVLLDTPYMQRLRGLGQLGTAFLGEYESC